MSVSFKKTSGGPLVRERWPLYYHFCPPVPTSNQLKKGATVVAGFARIQIDFRSRAEFLRIQLSTRSHVSEQNRKT